MIIDPSKIRRSIFSFVKETPPSTKSSMSAMFQRLYKLNYVFKITSSFLRYNHPTISETQLYLIWSMRLLIWSIKNCFVFIFTFTETFS